MWQPKVSFCERKSLVFFVLQIDCSTITSFLFLFQFSENYFLYIVNCNRFKRWTNGLLITIKGFTMVSYRFLAKNNRKWLLFRNRRRSDENREPKCVPVHMNSMYNAINKWERWRKNCIECTECIPNGILLQKIMNSLSADACALMKMDRGSSEDWGL